MKSIDPGDQSRQGETRPKTAKPYDKLRKKLLQNMVRDISASALKVWFVLGDFCREGAISHTNTVKGVRSVTKSEGCWPKLSTLADLTGFKERHIRDLIKELVDKGWLKVKHRPRHSSLFWMYDGLPSTRRWYALVVMGEFQLKT